MKTLISTLILVLSVQSAMAGISAEQQKVAFNQLEIARAEINTVKSLMPQVLKKSIGKNLQNAEDRIAYAQQVLAFSSASAKFYCVLETSFNGSFEGKGESELEARQKAKEACGKKLGNEFWCRNDATCTKQ